MATKTKDPNGIDTMTDIATKTAEDAKVAMNTMADMVTKATEDTKATVTGITTKATEETKALLDAHQKALEDGFKMWQEYSQTYVDFTLKATQQSFEQFLAWREQMSKLMTNSLKQTQELAVKEQQAFLNTTETFQTQAQTASERLVNIFTTIPSKK